MTRLSILLIVITALLLAPPSDVWAARDCAGPGINHQPETYGASDVMSVIAYNVYLLPISARDIPFMGNNFAETLKERKRVPYEVKKGKAEGMPEDDQKFWETAVQELTDKMIGQVDEALEAKQAEIMQV